MPIISEEEYKRLYGSSEDKKNLGSVAPLGEVVSSVGRAIKGTLPSLISQIASTFQSSDTTTAIKEEQDKSLTSRIQRWNEGIQRSIAEEVEKSPYKDYKIPILGMSLGEVSQFGQSLGASLQGIGTGIAGAKAGALAGTAVAGPAGAAVGGVVGSLLGTATSLFEGTQQQTLYDSLTAARDYLESHGVKYTKEVEDELKKTFIDEATKVASWESIPEAIGTTLELAIIGGLGKKVPILKQAMKLKTADDFAKAALSKKALEMLKTAGKEGAKLVGTELTTETITQLGQHEPSHKLGLDSTKEKADIYTEALKGLGVQVTPTPAELEKAPSYQPRDFTNPVHVIESIKEVWGPTLLTMGLLQAGSRGVQYLSDKIAHRHDDTIATQIQEELSKISKSGADDLLRSAIVSPNKDDFIKKNLEMLQYDDSVRADIATAINTAQNTTDKTKENLTQEEIQSHLSPLLTRIWDFAHNPVMDRVDLVNHFLDPKKTIAELTTPEGKEIIKKAVASEGVSFSNIWSQVQSEIQDFEPYQKRILQRTLEASLAETTPEASKKKVIEILDKEEADGNLNNEERLAIEVVHAFMPKEVQQEFVKSKTFYAITDPERKDATILSLFENIFKSQKAKYETSKFETVIKSRLKPMPLASEWRLFGEHLEANPVEKTQLEVAYNNYLQGNDPRGGFLTNYTDLITKDPLFKDNAEKVFKDPVDITDPKVATTIDFIDTLLTKPSHTWTKDDLDTLTGKKKVAGVLPLSKDAIERIQENATVLSYALYNAYTQPTQKYNKINSEILQIPMPQLKQILNEAAPKMSDPQYSTILPYHKWTEAERLSTRNRVLNNQASADERIRLGIAIQKSISEDRTKIPFVPKEIVLPDKTVIKNTPGTPVNIDYSSQKTSTDLLTQLGGFSPDLKKLSKININRLTEDALKDYQTKLSSIQNILTQLQQTNLGFNWKPLQDQITQWSDAINTRLTQLTSPTTPPATPPATPIVPTPTPKPDARTILRDKVFKFLSTSEPQNTGELSDILSALEPNPADPTDDAHVSNQNYVHEAYKEFIDLLDLSKERDKTFGRVYTNLTTLLTAIPGVSDRVRETHQAGLVNKFLDTVVNRDLEVVRERDILHRVFDIDADAQISSTSAKFLLARYPNLITVLSNTSPTLVGDTESILRQLSNLTTEDNITKIPPDEALSLYLTTIEGKESLKKDELNSMIKYANTLARSVKASTDKSMFEPLVQKFGDLLLKFAATISPQSAVGESILRAHSNLANAITYQPQAKTKKETVKPAQVETPTVTETPTPQEPVVTEETIRHQAEDTTPVKAAETIVNEAKEKTTTIQVYTPNELNNVPLRGEEGLSYEHVEGKRFVRLQHPNIDALPTYDIILKKSKYQSSTHTYLEHRVVLKPSPKGEYVILRLDDGTYEVYPVRVPSAKARLDNLFEVQGVGYSAVVTPIKVKGDGTLISTGKAVLSKRVSSPVTETIETKEVPTTPESKPVPKSKSKTRSKSKGMTLTQKIDAEINKFVESTFTVVANSKDRNLQERFLQSVDNVLLTFHAMFKYMQESNHPHLKTLSKLQKYVAKRMASQTIDFPELSREDLIEYLSDLNDVFPITLKLRGPVKTSLQRESPIPVDFSEVSKTGVELYHSGNTSIDSFIQAMKKAYILIWDSIKSFVLNLWRTLNSPLTSYYLRTDFTSKMDIANGLQPREYRVFPLLDQDFASKDYFIGTQIVKAPQDAASVFRALYNEFTKETSMVLLTDSVTGQVLEASKFVIPTQDMSAIPVEIIVGRALSYHNRLGREIRVWVAHNHPSGVSLATPLDKIQDSRLLALFNDIEGVSFGDSIIITPDRWSSYRIPILQEFAEADIANVKDQPTLTSTVLSQRESDIGKGVSPKVMERLSVYRAHLKKMTKNWASKGEGIKIVSSLYSPEVPQYVREELELREIADLTAAVHTPQGIYLFADKIDNIRALERAVFHEWFGHEGVRRLNLNLERLYNKIHANPELLNYLITKYNIPYYETVLSLSAYENMTIGEKKAFIAEELLAYMQEETENLSIVDMLKRFWAEVRALLIEYGFIHTSKLTEGELLRLLRIARFKAESTEILRPIVPSDTPLFVAGQESVLLKTDTRLSDEMSIRGLGVEPIQSMVNEITSKWQSKGRAIKVVESVNSPAVPEYVRQALKERGVSETTNAVHTKQGVFLFADKLTDRNTVERVLLHEWLGHEGISRLNLNLEQLYNDIHNEPELLQYLIRKYNIPYDSIVQSINSDTTLAEGQKKALIAEELLAYMQEETENLSIVDILKRFWAGVKSFLSQYGFSISPTISEGELLRILKEARKQAERINTGDANIVIDRPISTSIVSASAAQFYPPEDILSPAEPSPYYNADRIIVSNRGQRLNLTLRNRDLWSRAQSRDILLPEALSDPRIISAYPFLMNTRVIHTDMLGREFGASTFPEGNLIQLRGMPYSNIVTLESLVHERQHLINYSEGLPDGSNLFMSRRFLYVLGALHRLNSFRMLENEPELKEIYKKLYDATVKAFRGPIEEKEANLLAMLNDPNFLADINRPPYEFDPSAYTIWDLAHDIYSLAPGEIDAQLAGDIAALERNKRIYRRRAGRLELTDDIMDYLRYYRNRVRQSYDQKLLDIAMGDQFRLVSDLVRLLDPSIPEDVSVRVGRVATSIIRPDLTAEEFSEEFKKTSPDIWARVKHLITRIYQAAITWWRERSFLKLLEGEVQPADKTMTLEIMGMQKIYESVEKWMRGEYFKADDALRTAERDLEAKLNDYTSTFYRQKYNIDKEIKTAREMYRMGRLNGLMLETYEAYLNGNINKDELMAKVLAMRNQEIHITLKDWFKFFKESKDYHPLFKLGFFKKIATEYAYRDTEGEYKTVSFSNSSTVTPLPLNPTALAATYEEIRRTVANPSLWLPIYIKHLEAEQKASLEKRVLESKYKVTDGPVKGSWVLYKKLSSVSPKEADANVNGLTAVSQGTPWCTAHSARSHLTNGDMWVFVDETGRGRVAIYTTNGRINQVAGVYDSSQNTEPILSSIISDFLRTANFIGGDKYLVEEEFKKALVQLRDSTTGDITDQVKELAHEYGYSLNEPDPGEFPKVDDIWRQIVLLFMGKVDKVDFSGTSVKIHYAEDGNILEFSDIGDLKIPVDAAALNRPASIYNDSILKSKLRSGGSLIGPLELAGRIKPTVPQVNWDDFVRLMKSLKEIRSTDSTIQIKETQYNLFDHSKFKGGAVTVTAVGGVNQDFLDGLEYVRKLYTRRGESPSVSLKSLKKAKVLVPNADSHLPELESVDIIRDLRSPINLVAPKLKEVAVFERYDLSKVVPLLERIDQKDKVILDSLSYSIVADNDDSYFEVSLPKVVQDKAMLSSAKSLFLVVTTNMENYSLPKIHINLKNLGQLSTTNGILVSSQPLDLIMSFRGELKPQVTDINLTSDSSFSIKRLVINQEGRSYKSAVTYSLGTLDCDHIEIRRDSLLTRIVPPDQIKDLYISPNNGIPAEEVTFTIIEGVRNISGNIYSTDEYKVVYAPDLETLGGLRGGVLIAPNLKSRPTWMSSDFIAVLADNESSHIRMSHIEYIKSQVLQALEMAEQSGNPIYNNAVKEIKNFAPVAQLLSQAFVSPENVVRATPAPIDVMTAVGDLTAKWVHKDSYISVIDEANSTAVPIEAKRELSSVDTSDISGFYYGDRVFLIGSKIPTTAEIQKAIIHDWFSHEGLGLIKGDLASLYQSIGAFKALAVSKKHGLDITTVRKELESVNLNPADIQATLANYLLPYFAKETADKTIRRNLNTFLSKVKFYLQRAGFDVSKFTLTDVLPVLQEMQSVAERRGINPITGHIDNPSKLFSVHSIHTNPTAPITESKLSQASSIEEIPTRLSQDDLTRAVLSMLPNGSQIISTLSSKELKDRATGAIGAWGLDENAVGGIEGLHEVKITNGQIISTVYVASESSNVSLAMFHEAFHSVQLMMAEIAKLTRDSKTIEKLAYLSRFLYDLDFTTMSKSERLKYFKKYPILEKLYQQTNGQLKLTASEHQAVAFSYYASERLKSPLPRLVREIFDAIKVFFSNLASFIRGHGYMSAEQIFREAYTGQIKQTYENIFKERAGVLHQFNTPFLNEIKTSPQAMLFVAPQLNTPLRYNLEGKPVSLISTENLRFNPNVFTTVGNTQVASRERTDPNGRLRLRELIDFPILFNLYPSIGDMVVKAVIDPNLGTSGSGYITSNAMFISAKDEDDLKAVLIHELQHIVDRINGFASGGSPYNTFIKDLAKRSYNHYQTYLKKKVSGLSEAELQRDVDLALEYADMEAEARRAFGKAPNEPLLPQEMMALFAFRWYQRLLGEVMAREAARTPNAPQSDVSQSTQFLEEKAKKWVNIDFSQAAIKGSGYIEELEEILNSEGVIPPPKEAPDAVKDLAISEMTRNLDANMVSDKTFKARLNSLIETLRNVWNHLTRLIPSLDPAKDAIVVDIFRRAISTPNLVSEEVLRMVQSVIGGLNEDQRKTFNYYLVARHLLARSREGFDKAAMAMPFDTVPFGGNFNVNQIIDNIKAMDPTVQINNQDVLRWLVDYLEKKVNADPMLVKAVKARRRMLYNFKKRMVDYGLLDEKYVQYDPDNPSREANMSEDYFHALVTSHMDKINLYKVVKTMRLGGKLVSQRHLTAGSDFITDYAISEYHFLYENLIRMKQIDFLNEFKSSADKLPEVEAKFYQTYMPSAMQSVEARFGAQIAAEADIAQRNGDFARMAQMNNTTEDEEKAKYIQGRLHVEAKAILDKMYRDKFHSFIKEAYPDYEYVNLEQYNKIFRGYAIDARQYEQAVQNFLRGNNVSFSVTDVKPVAILGGAKSPVLVHKSVAEALKFFEGEVNKTRNMVTEFLFKLNLWTKRWILMSPMRVIKWTLNNTSGDVDSAYALEPGLFKYSKGRLLQTYQNLRNFNIPKLRGNLDEATANKIAEAIELRAINAGLYMNELDEVRSAVVDRYFLTGNIFKNVAEALKDVIKTAKKDPLSTPGKLIDNYIAVLDPILQARENTLRLIAFEYYQEKLNKFITDLKNTYPNVALKDLPDSAFKGFSFGGSDRRQIIFMIRNGYDNKKIAAKMAAELLGDYGAVSPINKWMAQYIMPFHRFTAMNIDRYMNVYRNLWTDPSTASQFIAKKLFGLAWKVPLTTLKLSWVILLLTFFNMLMFPREWEELYETQIVKGRLPLIWGRNEDGTIRTLRLEGAFTQFLRILDLESYPFKMYSALTGRLDHTENLKHTVLAPANLLAQSLLPVVKSPVEAFIMERSTFPDLSNPRPIRDKGEHLTKLIAAEGIWNAIVGKPADPNAQLSRYLTMFSGYTIDPYEAAYFEAKRIAEKFSDSLGIDKPETLPSGRGNSLYYFKKALKVGDKEAALKYLIAYMEDGGEVSNIIQSIKQEHPMASIPIKYRQLFRNSLTPRDNEVMEMAMAWYNKMYYAEPKLTTEEISEIVRKAGEVGYPKYRQKIEEIHQKSLENQRG